MTINSLHKLILLLGIGVIAAALASCSGPASLRGTGDLAVIVERAAGRLVIVDTTRHEILAKVSGLGDTSHASVVFSRDGRYAYVFGRDGGLTKVDILQGKVVNRVIQGGNSVGGAISQDGRLIAVANYEPGGVRVFDAGTLEQVADIPAVATDGSTSKVIGLVDAPGNRFVFSLYDAGETWIADLSHPGAPQLFKFTDIGRLPYDGLISGDGHYYIAGLFGEDGLALLDLWKPEAGMRRILDHYGRGEEPLPVYKMPHLEGWAMAGEIAVLPAVGRYEVLLLDLRTWREAGRIAVHGQPVFAVARPDARQVWVNFAHPRNDTIQVIDLPTRKVVATLKPGKAVLHLEFSPRGEEVWVSVRDEDKVVVYDTATLEPVATLPVDKPSGIFMTARAHRIGL